jgi:murein DD-endopeptidase MepM/ murein hydrolase activator NlpD
MQRRATLLLIAIFAVLAFAGRDAFLIPLVDRIQSPDVEATGWVHADQGSTAAGVDGYLANAEPGRVPLKGEVGRNSSMYDELRKLGVSAFDIEMLARDTRDTFNWRRVRAGQTFDLYTAGDGAIDSLILYTSPFDFVRVHRGVDRYIAAVEDVPFQTSYVVTHGTIDDSIYQSLEEQGAETSLANSLEDIFGWTIDFVTDLRQGDEYVLLYERRTYATGTTLVANVLAARIVNAGREYNAVRFRPDHEQPGYYAVDGSSLQKSLRRAPLKFTRISSQFQKHRFHPIEKRWKPHYGVDYAAPIGTPVYATGDGVIVAAAYNPGNGNYVKIRHNRSFETYYLHLSGFARGIHTGARVDGGACIGFVGQTGEATGPHLCYRMMKNGGWVNPRAIDLPAKDPVTVADMPRFEFLRDAYMARIHESLMEGVANRTAVVQSPATSTTDLQASMF